MANMKPLEQIKLEIDILSLDIDSMGNNEEKETAVQHLEEHLKQLKSQSSGSPGTSRPVKRLKLEAVGQSQEGKEQETLPSTSGENVNNPVSGLYNGLVPTCTQCGESFKSLALLDSHMKKVHPGVSKSGYQPGPTEDVNFMCNQCDFVTKRKDNFKNHISIHTGEFRCETCQINLAGRSALEKHRLTRAHEERKRAKPGPCMTLSCKKCDFSTGSVEELLSHSTRCRRASLPCELCDFRAETESELSLHLTSHSNELRCEICDVNFSKEGNLKRHNERFQHKTRLKELQVQGGSLSSVSPVQGIKRQREEVETSQRREVWECSQCEFSTKLKKLFEVHVSKHGKNKESSTFDCEHCFKTYTNIRSLNRHLITHSGRFECSHCHQGFSEGSQLEKHLSNPENCRKLLKYRGTLNLNTKLSGDSGSELSEAKADIHEELIIDEKEYGDLREQDSLKMAMFTCRNCNQGFTKKERLDIHLKNPDNCEKLLKVRENLKMNQIHPQVGHLVMKPEFQGELGEVENIQLNEVLQFQDSTMLRCEHCEESFKNVRSLRKHLISHTNKHKCQTCNLGFSNRQRLETHLSNPDNCRKLMRLRERKRRESATSNGEGSSSDNKDFVQVDPEELVIENEGYEELEEEIEVFQCPECKKYFSSKSSLRSHMVSHTDKYQCPTCEQGFSKKSHLETHIKSPINCDKLMKARQVEAFDASEFVEAVISEDESPGSPLFLLDNKYPDIIIEAKRSTGII